MDAPRLLSLGSINLDVQMRAADWPAAGESRMGSDCLLVGGGKAANRAYLARRLGLAASLIGRVGTDPMVEHILARLRESGVDLSHVRQTDGCWSGVSLIMTPPDGDKSILFTPNANRRWDAEDPDRVALLVKRAPRGSVLAVDLELSSSVAEAAVDAAHAAGLSIIVDPSPPEDTPKQILAKADFVTPDASEAERLTGVAVQDRESATTAAKRLLDSKVRFALVKLAGGGCVVAGNDVCAFVRPEKVPAVDTTGAGDAFAGALASALLEDHSVLDAVCWAVAAAGIAVTRYGSQQAYPSRKELMEQVEKIAVQQ